MLRKIKFVNRFCEKWKQYITFLQAQKKTQLALHKKKTLFLFTTISVPTYKTVNSLIRRDSNHTLWTFTSELKQIPQLMSPNLCRWTTTLQLIASFLKSTLCTKSTLGIHGIYKWVLTKRGILELLQTSCWKCGYCKCWGERFMRNWLVSK